MSPYLITNAGVPQGSVLGPLLFLIFVNDITDNLVNVSRLFADDTSISSSSSDIHELKNTIEADLAAIYDWSTKWKVSFNPSKTKLLFIGNCPNDFEIRFSDTHISSVSNHKHLGLTFSSNAKWSDHIDNICKSALGKLNFLKKFKYILTRSTLNRIYCSFIRPVLEYGCEVWDGCLKGDVEKLENVQLNAARIVTGLPIFTSKELLYFETGWEKLKDRRDRRKLTLFHKIYNGNAPGYLNEIVGTYKATSQYNLRNNTDLYLPNYRLNSTRNSFFPSSIRAWNELHTNVRSIQSFNQFKSILKSNSESCALPKYLTTGDRKLNIIHTRIRCFCSNLNSDLHRVNLTPTPSCHCGNFNEDAFHYFFRVRTISVPENHFFS